MSLAQKANITFMQLRMLLKACSPDFAEEILLASYSNSRTISIAATTWIKLHLFPLVSQLLRYKHLMTFDVLARLRVAIAPHKRMSPEILLEIFKFFVPMGKNGQNTLTLPSTIRQTALTIRRISSLWREVAIECLPLWRSILVTNGHVYRPETPSLHSIWSSRILAARSLVAVRGPVNIHIDAAFETDLSLIPLAINSLIKPLASRISTLKISAPLIGILDILQLDGRQFNSLTNLELDCPRFAVGVSKPVEGIILNHLCYTRLLCHAPQLEHLLLDGWNILMHAIHPSSIPWSRLRSTILRRSFDFDFLWDDQGAHRPAIAYQQLFPHLAQAANLVAFAISPDLAWPAEPIEGIHLVLPKLERLVLEVQSIHDWDFLNAITAGQTLTSFTVHCVSYSTPEPIPFEQAISFLRRSRCDHSLHSFDFFPAWCAFGQGYSLDNRFLEIIHEVAPNVARLRLPMALNGPNLTRISQGSLFRKLCTLECRFTEHPAIFMTTLSLRLNATTAALSRCVRLTKVRGFDEHDTLSRSTLEELNKDVSQYYGVDFGIYPYGRGSLIRSLVLE